jgi:hypothetical protein
MGTIKNVTKKDYQEKVDEGNRLIELFMGAYNIGIFDARNKNKIGQYHLSWDLLMTVIHKIKEKVFHEGYDMFMPEHHAYSSIGNACYDADLYEAWKGCVRWITMNFDLNNINLNTILDTRPKDDIIWKTENKHLPYFKISPHTIRRYNQRINYSLTPEEVCNILSTKELYVAYKNNGDGKYFIGDRTVVYIDDFKIITVLKVDKDVEYTPFEKISELKNIAAHFKIQKNGQQ